MTWALHAASPGSVSELSARGALVTLSLIHQVMLRFDDICGATQSYADFWHRG